MNIERYGFSAYEIDKNSFNNIAVMLTYKTTGKIKFICAVEFWRSLLSDQYLIIFVVITSNTRLKQSNTNGMTPK